MKNIKEKAQKLYDKRMEQYDLQQEVIEKSGINIVTCGDCGTVILHKLDKEELECPDCGFESEPCDFPDLNYVTSIQEAESIIKSNA